MKKTLLSLGTIAAITAPIVGVVSCGPTKLNYNAKFQGWKELDSRYPDILYEVPKLDESETDASDWLRTIFSAQLFKNQQTFKGEAAWEQPRWELINELNSLKEVGRFNIESTTGDEMTFFQLPDTEDNLHFHLNEAHYGKFDPADEVPFKPLRYSLANGNTEINDEATYKAQMGKTVGDVDEFGKPVVSYLNKTAEIMQGNDKFKMLKVLVGNQRTLAANFWKDKWFNSPFDYTPRLRSEFKASAFDKYFNEHKDQTPGDTDAEKMTAIEQAFATEFRTKDSIGRDLPWQNKQPLTRAFNVFDNNGHVDPNGKVRFMLHLTKPHLYSASNQRSPWSLATLFWIGDQQILEDAHPFLSVVAAQ